MFDSIPNNPFVSIFNDKDYDFIRIIDHINNIYHLQKIDNDAFQSSDFYLQYLRKNINGKWTNKHLIKSTNDDQQEIMLVNVLPYVLQKNTNEINEIIKILQTYDELYNNSA